MEQILPEKEKLDNVIPYEEFKRRREQKDYKVRGGRGGDNVVTIEEINKSKEVGTREFVLRKCHLPMGATDEAISQRLQEMYPHIKPEQIARTIEALPKRDTRINLDAVPERNPAGNRKFFIEHCGLPADASEEAILEAAREQFAMFTTEDIQDMLAGEESKSTE